MTLHVPDLHPSCERDRGLDLDTVVDHIDYVAERLGTDHVASDPT
ncbi:MAG: hypothetical protein ABEH78_10110 [Haloferacaceae archaeon]